MTTTTHLARDNHYVPLGLLKRWSLDGNRVCAYRTLVSHENVREWDWRPIRGLAFERDLYVVGSAGKESDELEHRLAREYEQPAFEVIDRTVINSRRLTRADRRKLGRLFAAQDVRTPLSKSEGIDFLNRNFGPILQRVVQEAEAEIRESSATGSSKLRVAPHDFGDTTEVFKFQLVKDPESGGGFIIGDVLNYQNYWIWRLKNLLRQHGASRVLENHPWSIAQPWGKLEWPLTDHPAVRLNYYGPGCYDLRGGWGNRRSDLMMPLTPKHLLYSEVGARHPRRFTFSKSKTEELQAILIERARHWIFATRPLDWVHEVRPRVVDRAAFTSA